MSIGLWSQSLQHENQVFIIDKKDTKSWKWLMNMQWPLAIEQSYSVSRVLSPFCYFAVFLSRGKWSIIIRVKIRNRFALLCFACLRTYQKRTQTLHHLAAKSNVNRFLYICNSRTRSLQASYRKCPVIEQFVSNHQNQIKQNWELNTALWTARGSLKTYKAKPPKRCDAWCIFT